MVEKTANSPGIHDMSGNVCEWFWDWYGDYIDGTPYIDADTRGPLSGIRRVFRGGVFELNAAYLLTSHRRSNIPGTADNTVGFRLARTP